MHSCSCASCENVSFPLVYFQWKRVMVSFLTIKIGFMIARNITDKLNRFAECIVFSMPFQAQAKTKQFYIMSLDSFYYPFSISWFAISLRCKINQDAIKISSFSISNRLDDISIHFLSLILIHCIGSTVK